MQRSLAWGLTTALVFSLLVSRATLEQAIDLRMGLLGAGPDVTLGQGNLTYEIGILNATASTTATGVVLTGTLPASSTYVSATASNGGSCSQSGGDVVCTWATLDGLQGVSATVTVTPGVGGTNVLVVSVTGDQTDPTPGNNSSSIPATVNATIDLQISAITDNPTFLFLGQGNVTYTIGLYNGSSSKGTNTVLTVNLPAASTYVSASATVGGTCSESSPGVVTCTWATHNALDTPSATIVVTPGASGTNTLSASYASSDQGDPNTGNNSDSEATTVDDEDDLPTLDAIADPIEILEDAGQQTVNLSGISAGAGDSQTLNVTATSNNTGLIPHPTVTYTSPDATASLSYTPAADLKGSAVITVTVSDDAGGTHNVQRTFTVSVAAVNDPPTLDVISDVTIDEDAGEQTIPLGGITAGPLETQVLSLNASSSKPTLIPNPTITYKSPDSAASLTFTPVASANGLATITVNVMDDNTINGGMLVGTRTFRVTVTSVDDPPTIDPIDDPRPILEDAAEQTIPLGGITAGPETQLVVSVNATSDKPMLIPNPTVTYTTPDTAGSLSYKPLPDQFGTAIITVSVKDQGVDGLNTTIRTFTVNVTPVNDPPTLDAIGDPPPIQEDAGLQTIDLTGIGDGGGEEQALTVTATSDDTSLIPNPTVVYTSANPTGALTYTPVPDANGTATITVTVSDGGGENETVVRTFTVAVSAVDDAPTLDAIGNATIGEDAGLQTVTLTGISAGGGENQAPITITATSNQPGLIPDPTITYTSPDTTGTLTYTPAANSSGGPVRITLTVTDAGAANNQTLRAFAVTVTGVNDPPTLEAIADPPALTEDDLSVQTVNLAGITAGGGESDTLTVTASSSDTSLIPHPSVTYTSPNTTGSIGYAALPNAFGTAVITVTVTDNGPGMASLSRQFTVNVTAVNDAPTLNTIGNGTLLEDAGLTTVGLGGIGAGAGEAQTLTVTATSNNPGLIPDPTVTYASANATGSLSYTPVADQSGSATITVTVTDNGGTAGGGVNTMSRPFTVEVTAVDDPPTLTAIPDPPALTEDDLSLQTIDLTGIGAGGGETQTLTVTATSNNTALIPNPSVAYTSPDATGSISYAALADAHGSAVITVSVTDGGTNVTSRSFTVTVTSVNDAPTISTVPTQTIDEDTATGALPFTIGDAEGLGGLTVTATSSNTTLVPNGNLALGGSGASRSITVTPAANQFGSTIVTLSVNDGSGPVTSAFTVTVSAVNDLPTITPIDNQAIDEDATTGPLSFSIGDVETPGTLTLTRATSNPTLVPLANVVLGGSGANRTVTVTPALNQSGIATLGITVGDGTANVTTTFTLTVNALDDGFGKNAPLDGATSLPAEITLSWEPVPAAVEYRYCADTTNNNFCDGGLWRSAGTATSVGLALPDGSQPYYWQARALFADGTILRGNLGAWWTFSNKAFVATKILWPPAGSRLPARNTTFVWDPGTSVTEYALFVGSTPGAGHFYQENETRLQRTVLDLPTDGDPVHVRLFSRVDGCWTYRDYTYDATTDPAAMETGFVPVPADYDGDGKVDFGVWAGQIGTWTVPQSSMNDLESQQVVWGRTDEGDIPVPGDYDDDGKADPTVWRTGPGLWFILRSAVNFSAYWGLQWGRAPEYRPVARDYDGDGAVDPAVWEAASGNWCNLKSTASFLQHFCASWGRAEQYVQAPGDYDGDGQSDPAVWEPEAGWWHFLKSSTAFTTYQTVSIGRGRAGHRVVAADFDGDGRTDPALWDETTGVWYIRQSTAGYALLERSWGRLDLADQPVPADYDGDGKDDIAVWRASDGTWYVLTSASNFTVWIAY